MTHKYDDIERIRDLCNTIRLAETPLGRIPGVLELRKAVEELERDIVAEAKQEASWQDIAHCYGVTRQTVFAKFGRTERKS